MKILEFEHDEAIVLTDTGIILFVQTIDLQYRPDQCCTILDVYDESVDFNEIDVDEKELVDFVDSYLSKRFVCDYKEDKDGFVMFVDNVGYDSRIVKLNPLYINKESTPHISRFSNQKELTRKQWYENVRKDKL